MSRTTTYHTTVRWTGEHWGHLVMGNGPEMDFSAPPDAHGHAGVLTPEDAFVAAANTCVMMMFIWAAERYRLKLLSYECRTEGTKLIELDRTEIFTRLHFRPVIRVGAEGAPAEVVDTRVRQGPPVGPEVQPRGELGEIRDCCDPRNHHRDVSFARDVSRSCGLFLPITMEKDETMTIQILGTGCSKCKTLYELANRALQETGVAASVEKVEDIQKILEFDILMTPGLAIDGQVKTAGRIPDLEEMKRLILEAKAG